MAVSRRFPALAACALLAPPAAATGHDSPPVAVAATPVAEVVPAARLRSYVAVTSHGLVSHPATADPAARTLIVRRDGPGEVEVHALLNDVIVPQAGTASLVVGGSV